jgi:hypothetical protein
MIKNLIFFPVRLVDYLACGWLKVLDIGIDDEWWRRHPILTKCLFVLPMLIWFIVGMPIILWGYFRKLEVFNLQKPIVYPYPEPIYMERDGPLPWVLDLHDQQLADMFSKITDEELLAECQRRLETRL